MSSGKMRCVVVGLSIAIAAAFVSPDGHAQGKGGSGKAGPAAPAAVDPPTSKNDITFDLPGVSFGMTVKKLTEAVEKILDEDYKPLYAKASPGVKMKQLDAALAEEKSAFGRSIIKFEKIPVALDSGPLKGEYTYNNKEVKLELGRKGKTVHFFAIQDNVWKVIVEHNLGGPLGKDFADACAKVAKDLGVAGRLRAADPAKGLYAQECDWKDSKSHLRLIDRGANSIAFAYEDLATLNSLPSLRPNKK